MRAHLEGAVAVVRVVIDVDLVVEQLLAERLRLGRLGKV